MRMVIIGLGVLLLALLFTVLPWSFAVSWRGGWPGELRAEGWLLLLGRFRLPAPAWRWPGKKGWGSTSRHPLKPAMFTGFRISRVRFSLRYGLGDPSLTALSFGVLSAFLAALSPALPKTSEFLLRPEMLHLGFYTEGRLVIRFQPLRLLFERWFGARWLA